MPSRRAGRPAAREVRPVVAPAALGRSQQEGPSAATSGRSRTTSRPCGSGKTTRTLGRSAPGAVSTAYQPLKTVAPVDREPAVPGRAEHPSVRADDRADVAAHAMGHVQGAQRQPSCSSRRANTTEISQPKGHAAEHHWAPPVAASARSAHRSPGPPAGASRIEARTVGGPWWAAVPPHCRRPRPGAAAGDLVGKPAGPHARRVTGRPGQPRRTTQIDPPARRPDPQSGRGVEHLAHRTAPS